MQLIDKIKKYNEAYRNGEPIISDSEYDALVEELKKLDPNNDWFKHIEPVSVQNSRKQKLPIPMRSLNKVKSIAELHKWCHSLGFGNSKELVLMPKFDGLSLLVDEYHCKAYSRGGAENEGQDCSEHYAMLGSHNPCRRFCFTYGEFMISRDSWEKNFIGKTSPFTGDVYKSPRNTAAGMLNRDIAMEDIKHATFFRYGIDEGSIDSNEYHSFSKVLIDISEEYNQEMEFKVCTLGEITEDLMKELFVSWNKKYPIDGIVVYINSIYMWKQIGRHQTTGNPLYAVAYKHPDFSESFETVVKDVLWKISKSGAFKPVVNIEAVDTGDCVMENPTGYNAKWIFKNKIAEGAKVLVTRSGGVIPKILGTITPASNEVIEKMENRLKTCPVCGYPTKWNSSGVELHCTNKECNDIKIAKILYFYKTMEAENMGEETIVKIFNCGFDSISKFLNIKFEDIVKIEGLGASIAYDILNNNYKIMNGVDMPTLMTASDCFEGIGKIKAQKIIDSLSDEEKESFYNFGYIQIHGLSDKRKTMQSFIDGMHDFCEFLEETKIPVFAPVKKRIDSNGKYAGISVCFSGFRNKELEDIIVSQGGKLVNSVSKNTNILVVKDKDAHSSKIDKAEMLGITIVSESEFIDL